MNEYNERLLKNVLEDLREEQDEDLLKEFEEAKNDPEFQVNEGEAEAFAKKYVKKQKKSTQKLLIKVAAVFVVLAIGFATIVPLPVQGQKRTVAELIMNFVNSEFIAVDNEDVLMTFEGQYIPSWIPDGYKISSVSNTDDLKEINFASTDGNFIIYKELNYEIKSNLDSEEFTNIQNIDINGYKSIFTEKDGIQRIIINTENSILYITSDDSEMDLIGFAKKIEKR